MDFSALIEMGPASGLASFTASALALVLATTAALAQGYSPYRDEPAYYGNPPSETVEVIAVRFTASVLCEKIDRNYASVDDGRSCYYEAVDRAMEQADAAIAEARGDSPRR